MLKRNLTEEEKWEVETTAGERVKDFEFYPSFVVNESNPKELRDELPDGMPVASETIFLDIGSNLGYFSSLSLSLG